MLVCFEKGCFRFHNFRDFPEKRAGSGDGPPHRWQLLTGAQGVTFGEASAERQRPVGGPTRKFLSCFPPSLQHPFGTMFRPLFNCSLFIQVQYSLSFKCFWSALTPDGNISLAAECSTNIPEWGSNCCVVLDRYQIVLSELFPLKTATCCSRK